MLQLIKELFWLYDIVSYGIVLKLNCSIMNTFECNDFYRESHREVLVCCDQFVIWYHDEGEGGAIAFGLGGEVETFKGASGSKILTDHGVDRIFYDVDLLLVLKYFIKEVVGTP